MDTEIKKKYDDFFARLTAITRNAGTDKAEFDCELCKTATKFTAFTAFMYPDHTLKALCNPCGAKEYVRLDYGNKN